MNQKPAGVFRRVIAGLIDFLVIILLNLILIFCSLWMISFFHVAAYSYFRSCCCLILFQWISITGFYFAFFESSRIQATLGKWVMRMKIVDKRGRRLSFFKAFGRFLGNLFALIILGIFHLLIIGLSKQKRGLHDRLSGTLVFREKVLQEDRIPIKS